MTPQEIFDKNKKYAIQRNSYITPLSLDDQIKFLEWVSSNNVPYDPSPNSDYDMQGYWKSIQGKNYSPEINKNDGMPHYPDTFKTPYHRTFSSESVFSTPGAPSWNKLDQLVLPDGTIVFDERKIKTQTP